MVKIRFFSILLSSNLIMLTVHVIINQLRIKLTILVLDQFNTLTSNPFILTLNLKFLNWVFLTKNKHCAWEFYEVLQLSSLICSILTKSRLTWEWHFKDFLRRKPYSTYTNVSIMYYTYITNFYHFYMD